MTTVAEVVDAVIGGDTHRDTHTLELASPVGAPIAALEAPNTPEGYASVIAWIAEHAPGPRVMIGLEGTRSYGVGLSRALQRAGLTVVEIERPKRQQRRGRGKSDQIDAHLAALALLRLDVTNLPLPRADGAREALRILLISRWEQVQTRTRIANQLHALLLTGDDEDRALGKGVFTQARLRAICDRTVPAGGIEAQIRAQEAHRLAQALLAADRELKANNKTLTQLVRDTCPELLELHGVGPVSAGQAIVTYSHHGRCRHEGAFAMLSGTAPLPANSGQVQRRHRLSRGGDRSLNRAIHTIAMTRWRSCPETADYIARRRADGKSDREIRRCLKRYISRQLYRQLNVHLA